MMFMSRHRTFVMQDHDVAHPRQRSTRTALARRRSNFSNSKLNGAYFIKAVAFQTNFENADISDVLFDRAVLNEANLTNTILQRTVFTSSDLGGAKITGADFTNALVDRAQQLKLCRYADGTNSTTGADTRKSLGCGSRRSFRVRARARARWLGHVLLCTCTVSCAAARCFCFKRPVDAWIADQHADTAHAMRVLMRGTCGVSAVPQATTGSSYARISCS
jgi:Pentapeptide repeats (8 copies)